MLASEVSPWDDSRGDRREEDGALTAHFLLIRHAAHIHLDRRLSGRMAGVPLSETGRTQAAALGRALAGERIDRILCSPLDRTRETAAAIAAARAATATPSTPEPVDALLEIDMGEWTGAAFGTLSGPSWDAWNQSRGTARIPGGETMGEAQARIVGLIGRLVRDTAEGSVVALVSHADVIRGAVAWALGLPLDNLLRFDVGPASVSRVVAGDWGARLISLNERTTA